MLTDVSATSSLMMGSRTKLSALLVAEGWSLMVCTEKTNCTCTIYFKKAYLYYYYFLNTLSICFYAGKQRPFL